jgi:CHASE2 domain-containing sensor protein
VKRLALIGAGTLALLVVAIIGSTPFVHRLEQRTIDTRFHLRGAATVSDVVVVAIDDTTFSDLRKQWPLPRGFHARVVDRLREAGAKQIVYDVQFTEASAQPRQDLALFDAVARARGTVLATGEGTADGDTRVLGGDDKLARIGATAAAANLPVEGGGVIRRYKAMEGPLASIASVVARRLGHAVPGGRFDDGSALIDFAGPPGTVPSYSFSDVHEGSVADERFRDRIVVVGPTSPTLQDLHPTAAGGGLMAGPEIQANAIRTALRGNPLQPTAGWSRLVLLFGLGGLAILLVLMLGPIRGAIGAVGVGLAFAAGAQWAFGHHHVLPVAVPLLGLAAATVAAVLTAVAQETAERRRVSGRNLELEDAVRARTAELEITHVEAVERLARAAELRDGDTGEHLDRMSRLCEAVALRLGHTPEQALRLRRASILHDVGKIGMPDGILRKPGKLSDDEIATMRRHTMEGAALLEGSRSPVLRMAEVIAGTHHERWDGTGYPLGLAEDEIPIAGRIAAVCDVYDALITERPYKRAWTPEEARAEITAQRGRHFDPDVVDALLAVLAASPEPEAARPDPDVLTAGGPVEG